MGLQTHDFRLLNLGAKQLELEGQLGARFGLSAEFKISGEPGMAEMSNPRLHIPRIGCKEFGWLSSLWGLERIKYWQGSIVRHTFGLRDRHDKEAHHIRRTRVEF
jgi:hypothetical protein